MLKTTKTKIELRKTKVGKRNRKVLSNSKIKRLKAAGALK